MNEENQTAQSPTQPTVGILGGVGAAPPLFDVVKLYTNSDEARRWVSLNRGESSLEAVAIGCMNIVPLVVDLDGTLILTDMLHESAIGATRNRPLMALCLPFWLARGKALLKRRLAEGFDFDPALLPYNESFLAWLRAQRESGRKLVLCTASDHRLAESIAEHLGLFDEVLASDGETNLAGTLKAQVLCERYGEGGFDYAGNSYADLAVWRHARNAIVVNSGAKLAALAGTHVERHFPAQGRGLGVWVRMLRLHQWLKNVLLFVPVLTAHRFTELQHIQTLVLGFMAFSMCASAVYVTNDLLDLGSDRSHPRKRYRPLASGQVPLAWGVALALLLLAAGTILSLMLPPGFRFWLAAYFLLTCAYSFALKRVVLLDCIVLAILYTLRIVTGGAATGIPLSFWLLAFSIFLFLSLAFVKRYAELQTQQQVGGSKVHGRGYHTADLGLVQALGVSSGYASVLVLALYLNSEAVVRLYRTPEFIWGAVPVLLFWVSWLWLRAHRGEMHDDPLVFSIKDRASLLAGALFLAVLAAGTLVLP